MNPHDSYVSTGNSRPTVLLIEDDALSLKLMKDVLEASNYIVLLESNGLAGLATALAEFPDLVVIDIGLPGMNGITVTRAIREDPRAQSMPILAISAYAMSTDEDRMRAAGCDAFMTKPLRFFDFVATVKRLITQAQCPDVANYPGSSGNEK